MLKKKSKTLFPIIGTAVVVTGGVAACLYWNGNFGDATSAFGSAKVVPDEALMASFVSTDTKSWSRLQEFGTPEAQNFIKQGFKGFNNEMLTKSNINYEKDVQPWLGSVMFAFLPSPTGQATQQPSVLVVVGIKNKLSALNFANKLKGKTKESDYKGIKISETTENSGKTYSAVLDKHLVASSERKPVELAIETFKGQPSFASKEGAGKLFSKGVDLKNPIVEFYVPEYGGMVQQLLLSNPNMAALPPETLNQLKQVKSLAMGVGVDNLGLRMKAIAKLDPSAIKAEYKPTPGKVVAQFPAETIALISGQGISGFWKAVVEQAKTNPQTQQGIDTARQQLKTINLDLDKDIFGWMDGEFALAAIPSNQGMLAPVGFGAALVMKTSDRASAQATLSKLDAIAQSNSLAVAQRNVQGKTVTEWQIPQQGALLGHGWLDSESVFLAIGGPIVDAIANKPNQSLDRSETFKAVTDSLQQPNGGYFYLDMDKTMSLVNRYLSQTPNNSMPPEATAILNSIRGIGSTATQPDKSTSQFEILLALKPNSAK